MKASYSLLVALASGAILCSSQAQVLLTIDVSNPAAVVFSAAPNPTARGTLTPHTVARLVGFFTAPAPAVVPGLVGSLADSWTGSYYTTQFASGYDLDLLGRMYMVVPPHVPFAGSSVGDLSAAAEQLPLFDAVGDIMVDDDGYSIVGQWQAVGVPVPEPHEYALMAGLGLLGFAAWQRRRG